MLLESATAATILSIEQPCTCNLCLTYTFVGLMPICYFCRQVNEVIKAQLLLKFLFDSELPV